MEQQEKPNIFDYNDFRKFLLDYQISRQSYEPDFSKSEFSRLLQLPNTRSYFNDVLNGKKVSENFVERFITVMNFSNAEAQFFRTLVRFNQASGVEERELAFEQLISLNKTPKVILGKDVMEYYKKWFYSAVRALLETIDFKDDYSEIVHKITPQITITQAKKTIELLSALGLIALNSDGFFKPVQKSICAPENFQRELVRSLHLQYLSLIRDLYTNESNKIAFSMTNTISISERGMKRLLRLTEKYQNQVRSLVHKDEDPADRVIHVTAQIATLTKGSI